MKKLIIIRELDQLEPLLEYIEKNDYIAFDTETTGVDKESQIIGFSFSADYDTGFYVITRYWDVEKQTLGITNITDEAAKLVINKLIGKNIVMHNAVFDCWMVKNNYGIELMPYVHTDTMILAHLMDENRHCGLKELGVHFFGEDAKDEQKAMKESVARNGGQLTKDKYELYKAEADLIAKYGAQDTILTIKLFYLLTEEMLEQNLDAFFFEESMPLLKGPTYDLNTIGLRIDTEKLQALKSSLEADIMRMEAFIYKEIEPHVQDKYPGTNKKNKFNIGANQQLAWLLFYRLGNEFGTLTKEGKEVCKALEMKLPYALKDKREFIARVKEYEGRIYKEGEYDHKKKKMSRPKKVGNFWKYLSIDKKTQKVLADKYQWVKTLIEYNASCKLLDTYVIGIQNRMKYSTIRPSFLQHGTTSGRYSSKNPNFQNLPRKDKRVKSCVVARTGKVFVGADYSQLEPRVFASVSQDKTLMACFSSGEDFYSVVGAPIFGKTGLNLTKEDPNSFAVKYPDLRDKAKVIALATPYGRTASLMASELKVSRDEAQELIDKYFEAYPKVELMMLESHEMAKEQGQVFNLFGRPRRMPEAKKIKTMYGNISHGELPYEARTLLNLAMNHRVQSTGASIMNRAAISVHNKCKENAKLDPRWNEVHIVMQVHDELILEGPEVLGQAMYDVLKDCMENTVVLPGVKLIAEPKVANNLADLK